MTELTEQGAELAAEFYEETCRRIDALPVGLTPAERDRLVALLSRVVLDNNKVPEVFSEPAPAP
ncbi:hypothetical protein [Streptomyces aquilus]